VYELLVKKLQNDTKIFGAYRVADNIIRLDFNNSGSYAFDLSNGMIYRQKTDEFAKRYQAPFDAYLIKNFSKSKIIGITLSKSDKIIHIKAQNEQGYKIYANELILEMTPKSKNAIILDENGVVSQALRYESLDSGRQVRVSSRLDELPAAPFEFSPPPDNIDIDEYIESQTLGEQAKRLLNLKNQKISGLKKKITNLTKELEGLASSEELLNESRLCVEAANFAMMNMQNLDIYAKKFEFENANGEKIALDTPKSKKPSDIAEGFFAKSKKLRKKAIGVEQEQESIGGKRAFFEKLILLVEGAKSEAEIDFYLPKPAKNTKQKPDGDIYEMVVDGCRVSIGKNAKGNEKLLKSARASDYWFHLKDIPSAHTLLHTFKNEPSRGLLEKTAKICAEFSLPQKGSFEVDFARRRDVSPKGGGRAEYVNYKTVKVYLD